MTGVLAGMAFHFPPDDDILSVINDASPHSFRIVAEISVYAFPVVVLLTSIPVFSIIIRYNLLESGLCKRKIFANFWAVLFPWVVAVPFYTGSGLQNIISWVGLIVNGIINFVIPILLYIMALRLSDRGAIASHIVEARPFGASEKDLSVQYNSCLLYTSDAADE
eukprot:TRINITY_DN7337_c0_g1_i1.p1 TRINITY_DN7337_c0_g1~~TRINITY_DN7337_c0_g1_i1.p1  ORF type:complete len:189 (-),score=25.49 TRINITY_DN7337_c0_g1_i1:5-499(-)